MSNTEDYVTVTLVEYGTSVISTSKLDHLRLGFVCSDIDCWCKKPYVAPKRTLKQKMRIQWNQFKYQLGKPLLKAANKLGAYNETDDWDD